MAVSSFILVCAGCLLAGLLLALTLGRMRRP
jgi:hypothetical protein